MLVAAAGLAVLVPLSGGDWAYVWAMGGAAVATLGYSLKPAYRKSRGFLANLTIAVPRGLLLKLAGWACVAGVLDSLEPWWIGLTFFGFLCAASSTKDLADEAGDRAAGIRTWVVAAGRPRVLRWMSLGFVAPWILLPIGSLLPIDRPPILSIGPIATATFTAGLMVYGGWIAHRMNRPGAAASIDGNHASWAHMYLLMMVSQFGLAALYLVQHWP